MFGILLFKLEKDVVCMCCVVLEEMGVCFFFNKEVGCDIEFGQLLDDYDVVFVGIGVYIYVDGELLGCGLYGVYDVLLFLIVNIECLLCDEFLLIDFVGKCVVVFGGGDIGMDCVCIVVCLGVLLVSCVYCCDEVSMLGLVCEVKYVCEEGVEFVFQCQLLEIFDDGYGYVCGVWVIVIELVVDGYGCLCLQNMLGSEYEFVVDVVIQLFGFLFSLLDWFKVYGVMLQCNGWVIIGVDGVLLLQMINLQIFVGGDNVCGVDFVVCVVYDGCEVVVLIVCMLLIQVVEVV